MSGSKPWMEQMKNKIKQKTSYGTESSALLLEVNDHVYLS